MASNIVCKCGIAPERKCDGNFTKDRKIHDESNV